MKSTFLGIVKQTLAIAVMTVLFSAWQSATAATIKLEVKVPGISSWVLVKVGSWPRYGGRVVWDPALGSYVTDDVARGETVRITVTPAPGETSGIFGIWCESKHKYLVFKNPIPLPYTNPNYVVPLDPAMDSLAIDVYSTEPATKFMPIGPRVK